MSLPLAILLTFPLPLAASQERLISADAAWQWTFQADGQQRHVSAADVVSWGVPAEIGRGQVLVLVDGSLVVAEIFGADKETLTADSSVLGAMKLPLEVLAGVVVHAPGARPQREVLLDCVLASTGDADRLVLDNGDELTGQIESLGEESVKLRAAVGPVEVKLQRVAAIVFNPALRSTARPSGLRAWVGLADGSRVLATKLLVDAGAIQLATAGQQVWKTMSKNLVYLQPMGGRVTYLSDLKPSGYRHIPYLDLSWPYRTDHNVAGTWLRSGGRVYLKGIGMHSASRLTYALDGACKQFQAELAIDDSTDAGGSVGFRVFVDGQQKYASPIIRGRNAPVPVSVEVAGAKRLDLVVDYAERADELDHANWLDARLVK